MPHRIDRERNGDAVAVPLAYNKPRHGAAVSPFHRDRVFKRGLLIVAEVRISHGEDDFQLLGIIVIIVCGVLFPVVGRRHNSFRRINGEGLCPIAGSAVSRGVRKRSDAHGIIPVVCVLHRIDRDRNGDAVAVPLAYDKSSHGAVVSPFYRDCVFKRFLLVVTEACIRQRKDDFQFFDIIIIRFRRIPFPVVGNSHDRRGGINGEGTAILCRRIPRGVHVIDRQRVGAVVFMRLRIRSDNEGAGRFLRTGDPLELRQLALLVALQQLDAARAVCERNRKRLRYVVLAEAEVKVCLFGSNRHRHITLEKAVFSRAAVRNGKLRRNGIIDKDFLKLHGRFGILADVYQIAVCDAIVANHIGRRKREGTARLLILSCVLLRRLVAKELGIENQNFCRIYAVLAGGRRNGLLQISAAVLLILVEKRELLDAGLIIRCGKLHLDAVLGDFKGALALAPHAAEGYDIQDLAVRVNGLIGDAQIVRRFAIYLDGERLTFCVVSVLVLCGYVQIGEAVKRELIPEGSPVKGKAALCRRRFGKAVIFSADFDCILVPAIRPFGRFRRIQRQARRIRQ